MRPPFVKCVALLLALAVPLGAASWEDEKDEWEKLAGTRFYKDPGYAAKLSLNLLPVDLGHFYVGEVRKGVWSSAGQTVALAALGVPLLNSQSRSRKEKSPVWTDGMVIMASAGGLGYMALKIWSAFDSSESAHRYNDEQEKQKKHGWRLDFDGRDLAFSRRF